jgi:DNA-binding NtrC family response regulator
MIDRPTVLVIDDNLAERATGERLFYDQTAFLEDYGTLGFDFQFCSAWDDRLGDHTWNAVAHYLNDLRQEPDVILLDVRFGERELLGVEILSHLLKRLPTVPVVMMTSTSKQELWESCAIKGAVDYIVKPIKPEILKITVDRYSGKNIQHWLVGQSENFLASVDQVARASEGGMSSILLLGSSGTGKELFAQFVHRHGPHSKGPFIAVHIPSISTQLLEAELFGYSKGAFTGAIREEEGRLLRANGGILFLDEVGDLTPSAQAALLRVLETREVTRLGDGRTTKLRVQVVSATNVNLAQRVKDNQFRLDLYNRLATTVVRLPQLSERLDDIGILVRHFLRRGVLERSLALHPTVVADEAIKLLTGRRWTGNLRELWNYVQRVLDLARKGSPTTQQFLSAMPTSYEEADEVNSQYERVGVHQSEALQLLPLPIVRNASAYLEKLLLQELSLLWSAFELTRDPVTGVGNRAKAASLLKGKKCSTNEFDRWVEKLTTRFEPRMVARIREEYPELYP